MVFFLCGSLEVCLCFSSCLRLVVGGFFGIFSVVLLVVCLSFCVVGFRVGFLGVIVVGSWWLGLWEVTCVVVLCGLGLVVVCCVG